MCVWRDLEMKVTGGYLKRRTHTKSKDQKKLMKTLKNKKSDLTNMNSLNNLNVRVVCVCYCTAWRGWKNHSAKGKAS